MGKLRMHCTIAHVIKNNLAWCQSKRLISLFTGGVSLHIEDAVM